MTRTRSGIIPRSACSATRSGSGSRFAPRSIAMSSTTLARTARCSSTNSRTPVRRRTSRTIRNWRRYAKNWQPSLASAPSRSDEPHLNLSGRKSPRPLSRNSVNNLRGRLAHELQQLLHRRAVLLGNLVDPGRLDHIVTILDAHLLGRHPVGFHLAGDEVAHAV